MIAGDEFISGQNDRNEVVYFAASDREHASYVREGYLQAACIEGFEMNLDLRRDSSIGKGRIEVRLTPRGVTARRRTDQECF